jgi:hypothetical protein
MAAKKTASKAAKKAVKKTAKKAAKKAVNGNRKVTGASVRMYRLGTGDCFVIKFLSGRTETFKMMIDCGAASGSKERFEKHVNDLVEHVANRVDVLVVTHEHKDHVYGFEQCSEIFTDQNQIEIGQKWMAWAEDEDDDDAKDLKRDHGAKKKALAAASALLADAVEDEEIQNRFKEQHNGRQALAAYENFSTAVQGFRDLHMAAAGGEDIGPLEGMRVVKEDITAKIEPPRYCRPGDVIEDIPGLEGIRIYVLGPPSDFKSIKAETSSEEGESYSHNKDLARSVAFAAAAIEAQAGDSSGIRPFDPIYETKLEGEHSYNSGTAQWRRIDHDWLMSSGLLALRLNSGINNLSLALAIEFVESGRVMLFPGDAEYGSWASWHKINWERDGIGKDADGNPKHLTEDLLNRTVFYKVAHHCSHNGTAKHLGLKMMTHKDLVAMATLDYSVISPGWKSTMPNREILDDLLAQSKGRLMVMNLDGLSYDSRAARPVSLDKKVRQARLRMSATERQAFEDAMKEDPLWIEFKVKG